MPTVLWAIRFCSHVEPVASPSETLPIASSQAVAIMRGGLGEMVRDLRAEIAPHEHFHRRILICPTKTRTSNAKRRD